MVYSHRGPIAHSIFSDWASQFHGYPPMKQTCLTRKRHQNNEAQHIPTLSIKLCFDWAPQFHNHLLSFSDEMSEPSFGTHGRQFISIETRSRVQFLVIGVRSFMFTPPWPKPASRGKGTKTQNPNTSQHSLQMLFGLGSTVS